ncbi:hypothetical protein HDU93_008042 [Gonapodya sp. JEL0774]|nr:hypothetical protein HDU93_008042 [Gonapodya sp. JEL0774]
MDSLCPPDIPNPYTCDDQGISAQCSDLYDSGLGCQWIDITHLPTLPGYSPNTEYLVSVTINPNRTIPEANYSNNQAVVKFRISDLAVKATNAWDLPVGADPISQAAYSAHSRGDPLSSIYRKFGVKNKAGQDLYLVGMQHPERLTSLDKLIGGPQALEEFGGRVVPGAAGAASGYSDGVVKTKRQFGSCEKNGRAV